jgi:hypothetical protein
MYNFAEGTVDDIGFWGGLDKTKLEAVVKALNGTKRFKEYGCNLFDDAFHKRLEHHNTTTISDFTGSNVNKSFQGLAQMLDHYPLETVILLHYAGYKGLQTDSEGRPTVTGLSCLVAHAVIRLCRFDSEERRRFVVEYWSDLLKTLPKQKVKSKDPLCKETGTEYCNKAIKKSINYFISLRDKVAEPYCFDEKHRDESIKRLQSRVSRNIPPSQLEAIYDHLNGQPKVQYLGDASSLVDYCSFEMKTMHEPDLFAVDSRGCTLHMNLLTLNCNLTQCLYQYPSVTLLVMHDNGYTGLVYNAEALPDQQMFESLLVGYSVLLLANRGSKENMDIFHPFVESCWVDLLCRVNDYVNSSIKGTHAQAVSICENAGHKEGLNAIEEALNFFVGIIKPVRSPDSETSNKKRKTR